MRLLLHAAIPCAGLLLLTPPIPAAELTHPVTATATIGTLAKLAVSPATLSFPDANPDAMPQIASATGPITITAKARANPGATITLTLLASDDLRSGIDTIPATALTWTASGPGFVGGTVSRSDSQTVGTWVNSGVRTGTQAFTLANSWSHTTGTYTVRLVYTLTAP